MSDSATAEAAIKKRKVAFDTEDGGRVLTADEIKARVTKLLTPMAQQQLVDLVIDM